MTEVSRRDHKRWIDFGRGSSILLVVLLHVSLWIENEFNGGSPAVWWLFSEAMAPIRMPLFFFISGYLAASAVRRPLKESKARTIGFYYIYAFWTALFLLRLWVPIPGFDEHPSWPSFILALVLPTSFWYIWALAFFFVLAWSVERLLGAHSVWLTLPLTALAFAAPTIDAFFRPLLERPADPLMFGQMSANFVWFFIGIHGQKWWQTIMNHSTGPLAATLAMLYLAVALAYVWTDAIAWTRPLLAAIGLVAVATALPHLPGRNAVVNWIEGVGKLTLPVYIFHIFAISALSGLVKLTGFSSIISADRQLYGAIIPPILAALLAWVSLLLGRVILASPFRWTLSPDWLKAERQETRGA